MNDRAVLFSIKPKYCELIASGKKTVEVRKTRPKIPTPFKGYIYCTKPKMITKYVFKPEDYPEYMRPEKTIFCKAPDASSPFCSPVNGNSKVIGEFVCDAIFPISIKYSNPESRLALKEFPFTCLTDKQIIDYLGNGKEGYALHISNLVIYDKPKELSDFKKYNRTCYYSELGFAIPKCSDCRDCNLKRPPQSWCYVEDKQ